MQSREQKRNWMDASGGECHAEECTKMSVDYRSCVCIWRTKMEAITLAFEL